MCSVVLAQNFVLQSVALILVRLIYALNQSPDWYNPFSIPSLRYTAWFPGYSRP